LPSRRSLLAERPCRLSRSAQRVHHRCTLRQRPVRDL